jgi:hypothetical protein
VTLPEPLDDDTEVDGDWRVVVVVLALMPLPVDVVDEVEVLWLEVLWLAFLAECPE